MKTPRLHVALVAFLVSSAGGLRASLAETTPGEPPAAAEAAPADAGAGPEPEASRQEERRATASTPAATAPAVEAYTAALAPAADAPKAHVREVERSALVPGVDVRQQKTKPIDPKITLRPGKGVSVATTDGQFEMTAKIRGQVLGSVEHEHEGDGETLTGVQIRRLRFALQGHMFGKHNKYKFEMALSPRDAAMRDGTVGTSPALDWYMTFDYLKEATVVAGQYKVPFSRQRVVSSGSLQMVDRSIVQSEFTLDRNVGVDVRSTSLLGGRLHYFAGVYGGEGRNAFELRDNNVVYLARVELLPLGPFNDYVEADFERTGPRVAISGSYAHVSNSPRSQISVGRPPADGGTTTFDTAEADVLLKMYGLSLTGELFWREGKRKPGGELDASGAALPADKPRDGYGWFAQAGYLLPHTMLEVEGRYGMIRASSADKSSLHDRQELGGGISHYFAQHSFKLQADYFRLWQGDRIADGIDQVRLQLEAGF